MEIEAPDLWEPRPREEGPSSGTPTNDSITEWIMGLNSSFFLAIVTASKLPDLFKAQFPRVLKGGVKDSFFYNMCKEFRSVPGT